MKRVDQLPSTSDFCDITLYRYVNAKLNKISEFEETAWASQNANDLLGDLMSPEESANIRQSREAHQKSEFERDFDLDRIPEQKRVKGENASYLMGPLTYRHNKAGGRFSAIDFGALYFADTTETAQAEVTHHYKKFCRENAGFSDEGHYLLMSSTLSANVGDMRSAELSDLLAADLDPYEPAQDFARAARTAGHHGLVFRSARAASGHCFALFWPHCLSLPKVIGDLRLHWDGQCVTSVATMTDGQPC